MEQPLGASVSAGEVAGNLTLASNSLDKIVTGDEQLDRESERRKSLDLNEEAEEMTSVTVSGGQHESIR